jgi:hypothetical protein
METVAGFLFLALIGGWFLWRRRAGRRQAEAQERMAEVIAPLPPRGKYPSPPRGRHRGGLPASEIVRVCTVCTRLTPPTSAPIGEARWLLVDVCAACASDVLRGVVDAAS